MANRVVNLVDSGKSMQIDGVLKYARRLSVCAPLFMSFHASFTPLHGQDIFLIAAVQDNVDDMIQTAAKEFQKANAGAAVNFFKFADAQRDYKLNGGFIDTVNGCEILPFH